VLATRAEAAVLRAAFASASTPPRIVVPEDDALDAALERRGAAADPDLCRAQLDAHAYLLYTSGARPPPAGMCEC
jgi:hypothetical protein